MSTLTNADAKAERERLEFKQRSEQHIYVIEFTSGTVKVGRAARSSTRLAQHAKAAQAHGHSILRSWTSEPHVEFRENETALIAYCAERWLTTVGKETFTGADYQQVVGFAKSLPFSELSQAASDAHFAHCAAIQKGFDEGLALRHARARISELTQKVQVIVPLVNDENRWAASDVLYEITKEATALIPAAWADDDPTAAERYLTERGTPAATARENAGEFELNFRALFALDHGRDADSFAELAIWCDSVTNRSAA